VLLFFCFCELLCGGGGGGRKEWVGGGGHKKQEANKYKWGFVEEELKTKQKFIVVYHLIFI
jgi:hypothetical protein